MFGSLGCFTKSIPKGYFNSPLNYSRVGKHAQGRTWFHRDDHDPDNVSPMKDSFLWKIVTQAGEAYPFRVMNVVIFLIFCFLCSPLFVQNFLPNGTVLCVGVFFVSFSGHISVFGS